MRFLKPPMYGSCWKTMTTRVAVFSWRSVSRFSVFGRDASTAATSTDMFGRKRRRYSDGGNDSASEANNSLLAVTDQQREQLAAPDGGEDASNNNISLKSITALHARKTTLMRLAKPASGSGNRGSARDHVDVVAQAVVSPWTTLGRPW
ncbi:hypothetical protein VaNZ11_010220 [Volvox africanus]|uniref:Uncharacterized protein n=3 Tax=Volvox africanus TaxID=51714 RepID=A0ABQ5SAN4_9CHLO|nr:hypothetical protein VaNZ11_006074 [Volvox africanus]GLI63220.1 hypothetical protein VaNZ11_006108 [Volvox africanus]GLI66410.1 hypothetical protein VaNZ11_010200 [Volvox africanus]GLI66412.1 hypothetical protein VaNZ11_010206 [Volvox africanus]GLI66414.1 hypothetical protein VaNZ11_010207 [Volvox africanus]